MSWIYAITTTFWTIAIAGSLYNFNYLRLIADTPATDMVKRILCLLGMLAISSVYLFFLGVFLKGKGWWPKKRKKFLLREETAGMSAGTSAAVQEE